MKYKSWTGIGAVMGFAGVALGAFGAHALQGTLEAQGSRDIWETAVHYLQWHAVAVLVLPRVVHGHTAGRVGFLWLFGIVVFSGSLLGLALGGPRWLGPVTPLGGLSLLAGWLWLAVDVFRAGATPADARESAP